MISGESMNTSKTCQSLPKNTMLTNWCTLKHSTTFVTQYKEKQIKAGSRQKKIDLINSLNKEWKDLYGILR